MRTFTIKRTGLQIVIPRQEVFKSFYEKILQRVLHCNLLPSIEMASEGPVKRKATATEVKKIEVISYKHECDTHGYVMPSHTKQP